MDFNEMHEEKLNTAQAEGQCTECAQRQRKLPMKYIKTLFFSAHNHSHLNISQF